jgi:hypothetical protein
VSVELDPRRIAIIVEQILACRRPIALATTGGGSLVINWLLGHPGASRAIVDAQIPYHEAALADYLGQEGPHSATPETARCLALTAGHRAQRFAQIDNALGVGATAALATTRDRRGSDRAHLVIRTEDRYHLRRLAFIKHAAQRSEQETILSLAMLDLLSTVLGTEAPAQSMPVWVEIEDRQVPVNSAIENLLSGQSTIVELTSTGSAVEPKLDHRLLIAGSFNPLHDGHRGLAAAASRLSGRKATLELSVRNVDKPSLTYSEVIERWRGVQNETMDMVVTREPTFDGKARLIPGCDFAIGYDTAMRVVEPRYYGTEADMFRALDELLTTGSRFFVAGRLWRGKYHGLSSIHIPSGYRQLFVEIPESDFRADISSTDLRESQQAK